MSVRSDTLRALPGPNEPPQGAADIKRRIGAWSHRAVRENLEALARDGYAERSEEPGPAGTPRHLFRRKAST